MKITGSVRRVWRNAGTRDGIVIGNRELKEKMHVFNCINGVHGIACP